MDDAVVVGRVDAGHETLALVARDRDGVEVHDRDDLTTEEFVPIITRQSGCRLEDFAAEVEIKLVDVLSRLGERLDSDDLANRISTSLRNAAGSMSGSSMPMGPVCAQVS